VNETAVAERPEKRIERTRNLPEITRGLIALVAANGNSRKAAAALAEDGIKLPHNTLHDWKTKVHAQEYERLRAEMLPQIRQQQADAHRDLERRQMEVSLSATDLIAQALPQMEHKDLINAAGKMDIGSGIHAEKAQLYDNQPTQIVKRSASDVLRSLKGKGLAIDVEVLSEEDVTP
jgi:hypothetical protein